MELYSKNPRQITDKQYTQLKEWLEELGDLSGIVHDLNSDEIVGGNQRSRVIDINNCELVIEHQHETPDSQGTVGMGYVIWNDKRYGYRQVRWTPEQCDKANIVANKAGGEWDWDILANEFDLDDLLDWGFSERELIGFNSGGGTGSEEGTKTLAERFVVPPFSVLDARQGYWQKRKDAWISLGIVSELGRGVDLLQFSDACKNGYPVHDRYSEEAKSVRAESGRLTYVKGKERSLDETSVKILGGGRKQKANPTLGAESANKSLGAIPSNQSDLLDKNYASRAKAAQAYGSGGPADLQKQYVDGVLMKSDSGNDPTYYFKKQAKEKELGRKLTTKEFQENYYEGPETYLSGSSIFDPVLCELIYRWFMEPGEGKVIDPFAGGSVRGIVAGLLGKDYTGIELAEHQVAANIVQSKDILGETKQAKEFIPISISGKWAQHKFSCTKEYITSECGGGCCEGSDKIMISLLPREVDVHTENGYPVEDGFLQADPVTGKCPHKQKDGLCSLHGKPDKPFGCIASPFTLNKSNTLIIRNRYNMMKCHGQGEPAYITFRASLDLILGNEEAERVCQELAKEEGKNIGANMPIDSFNKLKYLDSLKSGAAGPLPETNTTQPPVWIIGDSLDIETLAPGEYDLLFSCPPYGDLEVYSDDPRDISTMPFDDFIAVYRQIIAKSVSLLKDNRFACFVVGDYRDKKGFYHNFPALTIEAFQDAGMILYNEAILVTALGSLPIRAGRQFQTGRKLGKTHQNVLVFYKGDPDNIKTWGDVEIGDITEEETDRDVLSDWTG